MAAALGVAMLTLLGCAPDDEPETSTPAPSASPEVTYTDEELLEQARETYEGFLTAFGEMVESEDIDYTVLLPYATPEFATSNAAAETDLRDEDIFTVGTLTLVEMAEVTTSDQGLEAHVCVDTTNQSFENGAGQDVTPSDRAERASLTISFEAPSPGEMLVAAQNALADGATDPCAA